MTKYTFFLLVLAFSSLFKANAQVTAGVHDGLIIGQQEVYLSGTGIQPDILYEFFDSLDFNADGQFDVLFHLSTSNTPAYKGASSEIIAMHPGFEFVSDGSDNVARLSVGDAIGPSNTWGQGAGRIVSKSYDLGVYHQNGNWMGYSNGYVGFRIMTAQDTFYGWMPVYATVNANIPTCLLKINSNWAIEPDGSILYDSFVVAGDSSGLISGLKTISIHQGPVPFGGYVGTVDSLDLNEDGIFDVGFGASVCNTFDCFIGNSYLGGMHTGFNFVKGPIDTKRFDLGDTIGSLANWDIFSDIHVGEFISDGVGFGGPQSSGEWLNNYYGYLGFRLVTPASDTLLGWVHVYTYSLAENGAHLEIDAWAIQPDPSQKPVVALSLLPQKNAYCPGDNVLFQATTTGAEYTVWHFWDGTSDSSLIATRILPDSTVVATFEAGNQYGVTMETKTLYLSPLPVASITYDEVQHLLIAHSNSPGVAFQWSSDIAPGLTDGDSLFINQSGIYTLIAIGASGCTATESISIVLTAAGEPMQEAFRMHPNPAGSFILLENGNPLDLNFSILDATGTFQPATGLIKGNSVLRFGLESWPTGLYMIITYDAAGKPCFMKRFMKI